MAYTKHTWKERLGTKLNRFKDLLTGNHVELINDPESVIQQGTPIRADWLNEMEQGIFDAHTISEAARDTADGLADGTIQAGNAAKLAGFLLSYENDLGTVVRRSTVDGNIRVGLIAENGTWLGYKYMGITGGPLTRQSLTASGLAALHTAAVDRTYYRRFAAITGAPFHGGTYLFEGVRNSAAYGFQWARSYGVGGSQTLSRHLSNGTWSPWRFEGPPRFGTSSPPASGYPGEIYIQY